MLATRSYQIIYYFKDQHHNILQQIKYIDMQPETPDDHLYQWFHTYNKLQSPLIFIAQHGNTRSFVEGTLTIYPEYCLFNGNKYILKNISRSLVYSPSYYFHGIKQPHSYHIQSNTQ
jgi:hypothetical protein